MRHSRMRGVAGKGAYRGFSCNSFISLNFF